MGWLGRYATCVPRAGTSVNIRGRRLGLQDGADIGETARMESGPTVRDNSWGRVWAWNAERILEHVRPELILCIVKGICASHSSGVEQRGIGHVSCKCIAAEGVAEMHVFDLVRNLGSV